MFQKRGHRETGLELWFCPQMVGLGNDVTHECPTQQGPELEASFVCLSLIVSGHSEESPRNRRSFALWT